MRTLIILFQLFIFIRCHCPHMAALNKPSGPSAPATLPKDDQGWDYDEEGAPGSVPKDHFIQTSFVFKGKNEKDSKFSEDVVNTLRKLQETLRKEARVTVENENIDCNEGSHWRCSEFHQDGGFHYLVVEDKSGAAVYSIDRRLNAEKKGTIEMSLLDAFSRHSPQALTPFASKEAEHAVGFVRALSTKELTVLSRPREEYVPSHSPLELRLIEPKLLELRHGEGLLSIDHKLRSVSSKEEFQKIIKERENIFVLFWSKVDAISSHVFNLWAETSNLWTEDSVPLYHVECHDHVDFCEGLGPRDFKTVVAYRYGENIGTTENVGETDYYLQWLTLMLRSPYVPLRSAEEVKSAKKGKLLGTSYSAVTVASFASLEDNEFQHFRHAADKLSGRYALAYYIKQGNPTISSYRPNEKQKRVDYEGKFDPGSIIKFIAQSQMPSLMNITNGFTTSSIFFQRRSILTLFAPPTFDSKAFSLLAQRAEARKQLICTYVDISSEFALEARFRVFIESYQTPWIVLFKKDKIYKSELPADITVDELWSWTLNTETRDADIELPPTEVHPLRLLQVAQVNRVFGEQNTVLLPDHTLFMDSAPESLSSSMKSTGDKSGGCPFAHLHSGGNEVHDEL